MEAGRLKLRVEFDEPVVSQDATGDETIAWTPAFTLWASIEPLTGREQLIANQTLAEGAARIRIRWSPVAATINAKWRARYNGTVYNIVAPPVEVWTARRELQIMAKVGVNNG